MSTNIDSDTGEPPVNVKHCFVGECSGRPGNFRRDFEFLTKVKVVNHFDELNGDDDYVYKYLVVSGMSVDITDLPPMGVLELHAHINDLGWRRNRGQYYCNHLVFVINYDDHDELQRKLNNLIGKKVSKYNTGKSCGFS
jgi:hypothetical protein